MKNKKLYIKLSIKRYLKNIFLMTKIKNDMYNKYQFYKGKNISFLLLFI